MLKRITITTISIVYNYREIKITTNEENIALIMLNRGNHFLLGC